MNKKEKPVRWPRFAKLLNELMAAKGVTQYRIEEDTKTGPYHLKSSALSPLCKGTGRPTDLLLQQLSLYEPLGIDLETLQAWRALDEVKPNIIQAANRWLQKLGPDKFAEGIEDYEG